MIVRAIVILLASAGALCAQTTNSGQKLFHLHCAACHGPDARGNGPMANVLRIAPPDLTRLAQRNAGRLPAKAIAAQIDGTASLPGHGDTMPVYGYFFADDAKMSQSIGGQRIEAAQSILDLIIWLEQIQAR